MSFGFKKNRYIKNDNKHVTKHEKWLILNVLNVIELYQTNSHVVIRQDHY